MQKPGGASAADWSGAKILVPSIQYLTLDNRYQKLGSEAAIWILVILINLVRLNIPESNLRYSFHEQCVLS